MITRLILIENSYSDLERQTKDIDANWTDVPPSMNNLTDIINQLLKIFNGELYAEAIREYSDKKSSGIAVVETVTGNRIITIDISMKPVHGSRIYQYGETCIRGVLANEILSDKITVLSKKTIFRRAKDIVDVYALAHCVQVVTSELFELFSKNPSREIGEFDEFFNHTKDIEHAYNTLVGIERKPPFDDIYAYLKKFVQPFVKKDMTPKIWNSSKLIWVDVM